MNVEWLHEARSDEGGRFRIGRRGDTRIAEWDGTLLLEVGPDGAVRIEADESLATAKLRTGAVPALVGHLTGHLHWHAAACTWARGGAIVVLGDAGAGKSTLVAGLCAETGASFLADDVASLEPVANGWEVQRREKNHAMRPDMALEIFGHEGANKALFSPERTRRRAPLGLAVSLETGSELALQEMHGRQKVQLLTRNLVRFALDDAARLQRDLDVVLRIASEVPMYSLVRPRPFSDWRGLARLLRSQLRGELGAP